MEDDFALVIALVNAVLGVALIAGNRGARNEARRHGPVRGRVLTVDREEYRTRTAGWRVTTVYEVPGRADLLHHRRFFEDEGPAILWARLHREGSEHDVFPNAREPGTAFVAEDLRGSDSVLVLVGVVMAVIALATLVAFLVETFR